tara:strand:- start:981 stop:1760 length:780 start_codon:yes stop_codon:yes gene_type:complete
METHAAELLGDFPSRGGRFPWLAKILDAQTDLSVQVHPPTCIADTMKGESKTEAWYIAHAEPTSQFIAGLKRGTTLESLRTKIDRNELSDCLHILQAQASRSIFIPSGRVHSLGAGMVVFEIQENSDTTYRLYDWDRFGLDGKSRELHVKQALQSINFDDIEPSLCDSTRQNEQGYNHHLIAHAPEIFHLSHLHIETKDSFALPGKGVRLLAITDRSITLETKGHFLKLKSGDFVLIPASSENPIIQGKNAGFLLTQAS